MHFQNNRKTTIIKQKQSKPCPYHSRVTSTVESCDSNHSPLHKNYVSQYSSYVKKNRNQKLSQPQLRTKPKYNQTKNSSNAYKLPKIAESRVIKTQPIIDSEYYSYGQRSVIYPNYYEDLKMENEGWPSKYARGKLSYARQDDIVRKAQERVREMYDDQYYNVREQLKIINRIRQRYQVLQNISNDKSKFQGMLRNYASKNVVYETDDDDKQEAEKNHHRKPNRKIYQNDQ